MGMAELDAMIARVRRIPAAIKAIGPDVADAFRAELVANIEAGRGPNGEAWAPKKDGGMRLRGAAGALSVVARGTVIQAILSGPEVFHHRGTKHVPKSPILPEGGSITPTLAAAFRAVVARKFLEAVGRG